MFLAQFVDINGTPRVTAREGSDAFIVEAAASTYDLVTEAIATGRRLVDVIRDHGLGARVDLQAACDRGRLRLPIQHPDPTHMHLSGTGLTHLGSAAARDSMHADTGDKSHQAETDSMRMFQMGLQDGKPTAGSVGAQPEWFYKGNGTTAVAPGATLASPGFAETAGEEPEVAGIYVIGAHGDPFRAGFAIANEFSDHATERGNYLWLAHSKLRPASFGPELFIGDLPHDLRGRSRIIRDGRVFWEQTFLSGEANMSHSLANLEHHHFKHDIFRRPGDVHVHFLGTATLSFSDGIVTEDGDVFEVEMPALGLPLRNPVAIAPQQAMPVVVQQL